MTAGLDQVDLAAIPKRVTFCNVYGHESAIAEYALSQTMLVLTLRLFELVSEFRGGSWAARWIYGGKRRGEVMGRTLGIIGYGRIGREAASRAAGLKMPDTCRQPQPGRRCGAGRWDLPAGRA